MKSPSTTPVREVLASLYAQIDDLRRCENISQRGERIWSCSIDPSRYVEVMADGIGGARAVYARGQMGHEETSLLAQRAFSTEEEAIGILGLYLDGKFGDGPVVTIQEVFDPAFQPQVVGC